MMKLGPIIISLLDTDIYKFNMNQVIFHNHTNFNGVYKFNCKDKNVKFTQEMVDEINAQIDHLCTLNFTDKELDYLASLCFLKNDYIEFLRLWHPIRKYVYVYMKENDMHIEVHGPLFSVMQFEIYLLEIINEVYFRMQYNYLDLLKSAQAKFDAKCDKFREDIYTFKFAEAGSCGRLSREWQDYILAQLLKNGYCIGTSNVYLAMKYGVTPIGAHTHEYVQMYQGISGATLAYTNQMAMNEWLEEYQDDNDITLTDILGIGLFLHDFTKFQAMHYSGVRHDSGDPFEWGEKIIEKYKEYDIDPKTKMLIFSDDLDFDKAQELYDYFEGKVKVGFNIGTYLTNDTTVSALNISIKLQCIID